MTHWKRPWYWEGLGAGGERDDRGWDGWMASPTGWTWVWVNSGSWWWTGRPGMLRFMGSQRVGHDWATELNWTNTCQGAQCHKVNSLFSVLCFSHHPWLLRQGVVRKQGRECWIFCRQAHLRHMGFTSPRWASNQGPQIKEFSFVDPRGEEGWSQITTTPGRARCQSRCLVMTSGDSRGGCHSPLEGMEGWQEGNGESTQGWNMILTSTFIWEKDWWKKWWFFWIPSYFASINHSTIFWITSSSPTFSHVYSQPWEVNFPVQPVP